MSDQFFTSFFPNASLKSVQQLQSSFVFSSAVVRRSLSTTLLTLITKSRLQTCCKLSHPASPSVAAALPQCRKSEMKWQLLAWPGEVGRPPGHWHQLCKQGMNSTHHLSLDILIKAKAARGDHFIKTGNPFGSAVTSALTYGNGCNFI